MSNQLQITGGAKVRNLQGVITGTSGVLGALGINVPDGIPQLDGSGKILVSQLPNSVMEYKGTWNVATNTPYLVDGVGNAGDVYIVTGAATGGTTHDFGNGGILFYNGDQAIYDGSLWQRASGSSGTVTSVAMTTPTGLSVTGSPITTSGTLALSLSSGYIIPTTSFLNGLVPYTGATQTVDLGSYDLNARGIKINGTAGTGHADFKHQSGTPTGSASSTTMFADTNGDMAWKNDHNYITTLASNANTADRTYTFPDASGTLALTSDLSAYVTLATTQTISGTKTFTGNIITKGVIAQDGSIPAPAVGYTTIASNGSGLSIVTRPVSTTYENQFNFTNTANNTYTFPNKSGIVALTSDISYPVTSVFGRTGAVTAQSGDYTTTLVTEGTNLYFTDARARAAISLTTTGTSGAATYNSTTGVLNIPQYQAVLTNPVTGVGSADKVAFWNSSSNITYDSNFYYSSSNKRLGVNTNIPNATIGANISIDSGYGLIVKNSDSNYNGIGIGIDSTYGNLIEAQKLGSAPQRNLTLLNNAGYVSVDGYGNLGVNILTPVPGPAGIGGTGIDIYSGSTAAASIGFHTIYSGTSSSVGAYLSLNSANSFILRNSSGAVVVRADGDLTLNTFGYENLKIDSTTGKIGIGAPASITERLTVNGSIRQTGSIGAIVKTDANGVFGNATASVDYVIPSDLSNYVPTARKLTINGVQYDLSNDRSWTVGNVTGSGGAGRVAFWDTTSNISNNALFVWDDVNYRMGIGLNNPQRKLEIYSPVADTHLRISGSAPSVSMGEAITGSVYQAKFGLATAMNQFVTGSVAGDFVINNQTGSTIWAYNSTEKMRLDTSGNLGIGGTATTNYRLQIFAPSPTLGIESTTTGNMFLRFSQTGTVKGSLYWINSDSTLYLSNNDAGIKFVTSAANPALTLASTGAATFSSSVGIGGLTPFANSLSSSLDMVNGAGLWGYSNDFILTGNAYYNGGWTYKASSYATRINGDGAGAILFSNASSGTAGAALTWNERMRITSSGNVGIGTTSVTNKLTIVGSETGTQITTVPIGKFVNTGNSFSKLIVGSDNANYDAVISMDNNATLANTKLRFYIGNGTNSTAGHSNDQIVLQGNGNVGIGTSSPDSKLHIISDAAASTNNYALRLQNTTTVADARVGIAFLDNSNTGGSGSGATIQASNNGVDGTGNLLFGTLLNGTNTERMRITSGGNVLVGGTTAGAGNSIALRGDYQGGSGYGYIQTSGSGSNTEGMYLYNSTGLVGSIGTNGTGFTFSAGTTERFRLFASGNVRFSSQVYGNTVASPRTLYIASDGELGGISSIRASKTNINEIDSNWLMQLNPVSFNYRKKDEQGNYTEEYYNELFYGLIAEETELVNKEICTYNDNELVGIEYSKLVPVLVKAIQEQQAQIEELKALIKSK